MDVNFQLIGPINATPPHSARTQLDGRWGRRMKTYVRYVRFSIIIDIALVAPKGCNSSVFIHSSYLMPRHQ